MKFTKYMVVCLALLSLAGCLHNRGIHTVPVERDYGALQDIRIEDAEPIVKTAHRVGAHHFAPYEYTSAYYYLKWAKGAFAESDRKGEKDYSTLAKMFGEEAIAKGSGIQDKGEMAMPEDWDACWAEFERLKARYLELDACKAKLVAPVVYAHIEANLAQAEHELKEKCHYPQAARHLRWVEPDIDSIWAKDADADGIKDMFDGEPWIPEDHDSFQDEDGIPEPKPYPVLSAVNFASDSDKLNAEARGYLRGVANMLIDGYSEVTVYLTGHTDSDSSDEYNMDLSRRRVENVRAYLLANGALNDMVDATYYGESKPTAENTSSSGKAQNRRVELRLDSPDVKSPYCN